MSADPEDQFKRRLRSLCKFAIEELELGWASVKAEARAAFEEVRLKREAALAKEAQAAQAAWEEEDDE